MSLGGFCGFDEDCLGVFLGFGGDLFVGLMVRLGGVLFLLVGGG